MKSIFKKFLCSVMVAVSFTFFGGLACAEKLSVTAELTADSAVGILNVPPEGCNAFLELKDVAHNPLRVTLSNQTTTAPDYASLYACSSAPVRQRCALLVEYEASDAETAGIELLAKDFSVRRAAAERYALNTFKGSPVMSVQILGSRCVKGKLSWGNSVSRELCTNSCECTLNIQIDAVKPRARRPFDQSEFFRRFKKQGARAGKSQLGAGRKSKK